MSSLYSTATVPHRSGRKASVLSSGASLHSEPSPLARSWSDEFQACATRTSEAHTCDKASLVRVARALHWCGGRKMEVLSITTWYQQVRFKRVIQDIWMSCKLP